MDNNNFNQNTNPYSNGSYGQPLNNMDMETAYKIKHQQELQSKTGLAIASLVLGILSILCCCLGFGWIFAIIGLILGIVSLAQHKGGKGMAIGGIVTSAIALLLTLIFIIELAVGLKEAGGELGDIFTPEGIESLLENSAEQYKEENGEYPEFYYELHMDEEDWFDTYILGTDGSVKGMNPAEYSYVK